MEWYEDAAVILNHHSNTLRFYSRLLAHSDEAEPAPEPTMAEGAPAPVTDTPSQDSVAGATSQQVSTTETAKSMKCDVYVHMNLTSIPKYEWLHLAIVKFVNLIDLRS